MFVDMPKKEEEGCQEIQHFIDISFAEGIDKASDIDISNVVIQDACGLTEYKIQI